MKEENRSEIIHDALNELDDDLIEQVDGLRRKLENAGDEHSSILKTRNFISWKKWTAFAASTCVLVIAGWVWGNAILPDGENDEKEEIVFEEQESGNEEVDAVSDLEMLKQEEEAEATVGQHFPFQSATTESLKMKKITIPALDVSLERNSDIACDMIAFFIYQGRCYVENGYYEDVNFVGDYVGAATGMIDEWTTSDGYVDYAGSVSGSFYEVKGYDPAFMLCMKHENERVQIFIHNNGIELEKGSDLIKTRLNLQGNYEKVGFLTHEERKESLTESHLLSDTHRELFDTFLAAFCEADFMLLEDTPLVLEGENLYAEDEDNYYICFYTKEGLKFYFWLLEDGYVIFQGLNGVCVQIDIELYGQILEVLK